MTTAHTGGADPPVAMFENVIVGADNGSEGARDALWLARQLASAHGRLTLAYVQVVMKRPDEDSGAQSLAAERRRVLQELETLRATGALSDEEYTGKRAQIISEI